jgi:hypothetical protein
MTYAFARVALWSGPEPRGNGPVPYILADQQSMPPIPPMPPDIAKLRQPGLVAQAQDPPKRIGECLQVALAK